MTITRASMPKQLTEGLGSVRKRTAKRKDSKVVKMMGGGTIPSRRERRASEAMTYELRPSLEDAVREGLTAGALGLGDPSLPLPPEMVAPPPSTSVRPRRSAQRVATRRREMSADELNEREMTRILNDRSLAAARAGRNMYKCGGKVRAKGKK